MNTDAALGLQVELGLLCKSPGQCVADMQNHVQEHSVDPFISWGNRLHNSIAQLRQFARGTQVSDLGTFCLLLISIVISPGTCLNPRQQLLRPCYDWRQMRRWDRCEAVSPQVHSRQNFD